MITTPMRAREIARWFIAWADNIDAGISNLKLQKLLYYAQGRRLAESHERLFAEDIQAWAHGPVVPAVYHEFKEYGANPIDADVVLGEDFDWDDFKHVESCLLHTWDTYGSLAAWALRDKTHSEPPWREAFESGWNNIITAERLEDFFVNGR
jgi:uncharacterized phage-associated protein